MALASLSWQACLRTTMQLLPDFLVTGATPAKAAQGSVIAALQGVPGFCEQRGKDDRSHSRQGDKDLHVMLFCLPWLGFCCGDQAYGQSIKLAMRLLELPIHKADAFNKAAM